MRENPAYPSVVELARLGNFQAIAYWLNQSLIPAGIYASVGASRHGCVGIWVELPPLGSNNWYLPTLQRQVVRFICHQIWKLNSDAIDGVRIVARFAGQRRVLWKQSVRIVTPASRGRQGSSLESSPSPSPAWLDTYDTVVRTVPIVGTAALAFIFGFWVTTRERHVTCDPPCADKPSTPVSPTSGIPQVVDTIDMAGERVSVFAPSAISNPDNPEVTLLVTGEAGISQSGEDLDADVTISHWHESRMLENRAAALVDGGVDVVDLAGEEMMAQEGTQLAAALAMLDRSGLPYIGAGRNQVQARRPTILEVKDRRVAYFSYATAKGLGAGDDRLGLNFSDRDGVAEEIRAIRSQVDWVVVNLHWDGELSETPDPWQMELAHSMIDAGADLVVGYHPQVLQGAEIYRDRPIVYALSHFILGEPTAADFETAAIEVALKDDQMKIEVLPIQVRGFQPRIAEGESGRAILETFEDRSSVFDRPLPPLMVLSLQPDAEPIEASEDPNSMDIDIDEGFGDPSGKWQGDGIESDTDLAPDVAPSEEESDPFIRDSFISDPQESSTSGRNQSKRRVFPRLWLPFEPKSVPESVPENRDSRQGRRLIDLPRIWV